MRKIFLLPVLLFIALQASALKPEKAYKITPDSLGISFREEFLKTKDNYDIITWTFEPNASKDKKTVMVLAYGDAGNMSYWINHARTLSEAGYRIITFDYRGFGKSSDFTINQDYLYYNEFAEDLRTVMNFASKSYPESKQGVFAFSMGTIMATLVLPQTKAAFFIAEGYVKDPQRIVDLIKQAKNRDILLPAKAGEYSRLAEKIACPMLLVAGKSDTFTTVADSTAIASQARNRKVIEFEGSHGMGFQALSKASPGDVYVQQINDFLK